MLITELKQKEEILSLISANTVIIGCIGCSEMHFPRAEALGLQNELLENGCVSAVIMTDYICNPEHLQLQLKKHISEVDRSDSILVFSCGVGVQTVAETFENNRVLAACDTYPLPGHQGVTPLEYDCDQCGECYLSYTGGICPITACSKSLVNGQCGGSKNGKCEVDKDMECGWERIYRRLEKLNLLSELSGLVKVRNFAPDTGSGKT